MSEYTFNVSVDNEDAGHPASQHMTSTLWSVVQLAMWSIKTATSVSLVATLLTLLITVAVAVSPIRNIIKPTLEYWSALFWYWVRQGCLEDCPRYRNNKRRAAYVYSLANISFLWSRPHYRNGSFQHDMVRNLRNVALPGTGVPLSLLCYTRLTALPFIALGLPLLCLAYALVLAKKRSAESICAKYEELLLEPEHWFAFWRLNCRLASFHSHVTQTAGYRLEDKWTFLVEAEKLGVPVSPALDIPSIVVKDRNEEGGMGIHVFANARNGGRWIIQPRLNNDDSIGKWLPADAPLSTFRVITASRNSIDVVNGSLSTDEDEVRSKVTSLSCVFRAGRSGASTDHKSVLFDVDVPNHTIKRGTTNAHWYQLGLHKDLFQYKPAPEFSSHPDSGQKMTGCDLPAADEICKLAEDAHARMLPDVPLCGWDVALTKEHGTCLLEVNLSCNFFNGTFDRAAYFDFVHELLSALDKRQRQSATA